MIARAHRSALVLVLALGCGERGEAPRVPEEVGPAPALPHAESEGRRDALYGDDGELLESDEVVAGLRLPRGLELTLSSDRRHVYRSDVPLVKLQRYFGPRLITGEVDARPSGSATFRDALPRDARGGQVRLDVTIEPSSSAATRVEIVERMPAPLVAPPQDETLRSAREAWRQAD